MLPFATLIPAVTGLLDKIIPDPEARDRAKLELVRQQQAGNLRETEIQLSAILAEARSADPWTSRARPSFLYVVYVMILAAIPMGFLHAAAPDMAARIAEGVRAWLAALPDDIWWLFGAGYLGYTGARTLDKRMPRSAARNGQLRG